MRFRIGLRHVVAGPGDVVEVEPGVVHGFANAGNEEALVSVEVRPALEMEEMLAEVVEIAEAGRMTRRGLPRNPIEFASLARRYDRVAHAPWLNVHIQRFLLAPLVVLARTRRAPADRDGGRRAMPDLLVAATLMVALGCGAERRRVLRVLELRDEGAGPPAGARGDRGDAVDQRRRAHAVVHDRAVRNRRGGCVGLAAWAILDWHGSASPWLLIGGALYVAGPIGLTAAYHQPRNLALATVRTTRLRGGAGRGGATWRSGRRSITSGRWRRWAAAAALSLAAIAVAAEPPKYHPGDSARAY